jgi:hypothetical protein
MNPQGYCKGHYQTMPPVNLQDVDHVVTTFTVTVRTRGSFTSCEMQRNIREVSGLDVIDVTRTSETRWERTTRTF